MNIFYGVLHAAVMGIVCMLCLAVSEEGELKVLLVGGFVFVSMFIGTARWEVYVLKKELKIINFKLQQLFTKK